MPRFEKYTENEAVVSKSLCKWREAKDNIIHLDLPSTDGTMGEGWVKRLKKGGLGMSSCAEAILRAEDFWPTHSRKINAIILKGASFPGGGLPGGSMTTENVFKRAYELGFELLEPEAACLIHANFTGQGGIVNMGISRIVVAHRRVTRIPPSAPSLLCVDQYEGGGWLSAFNNDPNSRWGNNFGFAFAAP